jgi:hypothetical protein
VYSETNNSFQTKIALDIDGFVTDKTCFIVTCKTNKLIEHVYKVMSSIIFSWYMSVVSPLLGNCGISLTEESVHKFPLCKINDTYDLSSDEQKFIEKNFR